MNDADIISHVRSLRKLVVTLDALGFPIHELENDVEFSKYVLKRLPKDISKVSFRIHQLVQNIEKSKRYKEAIKNLSGTGDDDGRKYSR